MGVKGKKDKFIAQAGILAIAGIISRIIGLLYRSPLTAIIGDEGIGYYASAYNMYTIVLLVSSYSIPSAISKLIAQKIAQRQYIDAHRIFKSGIYYVLLVGALAGLFLYVAAPYLVEGPSITVLRAFSPTIFVYGVLGVLRGYFQAHKSMVQTSLSQIAEQLLNCLISIGAAVFLITLHLSSLDKYTIMNENEVFLGEELVSIAEVILDNDGEIKGYELTKEQQQWNTDHAMYGAIGSACGTGIGVVTALAFMGLVYRLNYDFFHQRIKNDMHSKILPYGNLLAMVTNTITPFILSTALYNMSTALNQTIFTKYMVYIRKEDVTEIAIQYGIFSGKAVVIANIPIAMASAMSVAIIPTVAIAMEQKDLDGARRKVASAIRTVMLITIPCAVGIGVLAKPITWVLYPQKDSIELASQLLRLLVSSIVFYSLSTLTNGILQGIGKIEVPVKHTAVALIIQTVLLITLLLGTPLQLYSMAIVNIMYSFLICILNQKALRKHLDYTQEIRKTMVIPIISAIVMGGVVWGMYEIVYTLLKSELIAIIPAIFIGGMIYFIVVLKLKGLEKEELLELPKGHLLLKLAQKGNLM